MTGKEKTSTRGRGGNGDQAPSAEKLAEIEKMLGEGEPEVGFLFHTDKNAINSVSAVYL